MKLASILISIFFTLIGSPGVKAEEVKLRVTMQVSASNPLGKNVMDYKQAIEAASGGTVTLQIFDKGQLVVDNQVPYAVGSGSVEMGIAQLGFFAKEVPGVEIFQQPFLFDSDELTRAAARPGSELRRYIDDQILEKLHARVLWWQPYGATVIMSKNTPLLNPDAMKGRQVRPLDAVAAEFVSLCGATPHVVPGTKMLEALQSNLVDSVMTGVSGIPERELWRESQFVTRIRHSAIVFVGIINEKTWQSLSKQQQDLMIETARKQEDGFWDRFAASEAEAYRLATEKGMQVRDIRYQ